MTLAKVVPRLPRLQSAARLVYGIVAIPVACWCLFMIWAVAKMKYDAEAVGPLVPFLLVALLVPLTWLAGLIGSIAFFRRGKRWLPWAIGFLAPLLLWVAYFVSTFLIAILNTGHSLQMGS
jgi:hypothetical protein